MTFYQNCLGGELHFRTLGESPMGNELPDGMKDRVLQATLKRDDLVLMGTDLVEEDGLKNGNSVSIMLNCKTETELREYYQKLALGGTNTYEIRPTFWGALFGSLTDRFENRWLFYCSSRTKI